MGNFWSEYTGEDSKGNGVGDTPYVICPGVDDKAPVIKSNIIVNVPIPSLDLAPVKQPPSGEITIDNKTIWENNTVELDQVLNISYGGSLILRNVTLKINVEREEAVKVLSGGNLEIYNSIIEGRGHFVVKEGGKIHVENSRLDSLSTWDGGGALDIYSDGAIIKNNIIQGGYVGIRLFSSTNHEIIGNSISNSSEGIIFWDQEKGKNIIRDNIISNIIVTGIKGSGLTDSTITGNTMKNIWGNGILLRTWAVGKNPKGNIIYNNDFINCKILGATEHGGINNLLYNESRGNYWSDYSERYPDAKENYQYEGIWDTPYGIRSWDGAIVKEIHDLFPLMMPNNKSNIEGKQGDGSFVY